MTYIIKEYKTYNEDEILSLYQSVGWTNYTKNPTMLKEAYCNSLKIYGAYVNKTDSDSEKLVGIIRVVGDGHSVIFIQDILVDPDYQGNKIATTLFQQIQTDYASVYQMHLLTEDTDKTIAFYQSLGFVSGVSCNCIAFSKYNLN